ncbi:MAG: Hpt domain-containing protein [Armatimonadetes bacterium]|nr:Hpt domain-containing protein [Armatimonadota bacterium]
MEPVVDADSLWDQFDDDPQLLEQVVSVFREDCPHRLEQARQAIANQDPEMLTRAAHTVKGTTLTLAAGAAHRAARDLERLGKDGRFSEAVETLAVLEAELARLFAALDLLQSR